MSKSKNDVCNTILNSYFHDFINILIKFCVLTMSGILPSRWMSFRSCALPPAWTPPRCWGKNPSIKFSGTPRAFDKIRPKILFFQFCSKIQIFCIRYPGYNPYAGPPGMDATSARVPPGLEHLARRDGSAPRSSSSKGLNPHAQSFPNPADKN